jgi:hypothetical protein
MSCNFTERVAEEGDDDKLLTRIEVVLQHAPTAYIQAVRAKAHKARRKEARNTSTLVQSVAIS